MADAPSFAFRIAIGRAHRGAAALALPLMWLALASPWDAHAAPGDLETAKARGLQRMGRCDEAIPLYEAAEEARHRPSSAVGLADCLVERGEWLRARELYARVAEERRSYRWSYFDVVAWRAAKRKRDRLDARMPSLRLVLDKKYDDLVVELDGERFADPETARKIDPGEHRLSARAEGHEPIDDTIVIEEGEARELEIALLPKILPQPVPGDDDGPDEPDEADAEEPTGLWLGARVQGTVIPQFVFHLVGEGGTTVFAPGAGVTVTYFTEGPELVFGLSYASYGMGETPFKPDGTPDTEYEIVESTLMSLAATVDAMWSFPIDARERVRFRVGGSVGLGWMFGGELYRTQAYPPSGIAGEPATYEKCDGPNDPPGTFRYCNQLDKDAEHYDGYSEPNWFEGGSRPLLYPWLVLPQLGLSYRPTNALSVDFDTGITFGGFLMHLGFRYGL